MLFTLSTINIATNGPITTQFYMYHHWGEEKAWLEWIGTLVSMATDSYHGVITGKRCCHFFSAFFFHSILFILAGNINMMHESSEEFEIKRDSTTDCGVSCPLASEKFPWTHNGKNGVATFSQLFLIESFLYLQVTMSYTRAWMSSKFSQIRPRTTELSAIERLKNRFCHFFSAVFHEILFLLTGNDDMHRSSEEFEIRPDPTTDCRASCPWASDKIPIDL